MNDGTFAGLTIPDGQWDAFVEHETRKSQIEANKISYSWDESIEEVSQHVTTGTIGYMSPSIFNLDEIEQMLRLMVNENRISRRHLAQCLLDARCDAITHHY